MKTIEIINDNELSEQQITELVQEKSTEDNFLFFTDVNLSAVTLNKENYSILRLIIDPETPLDKVKDLLISINNCPSLFKYFLIEVKYEKEFSNDFYKDCKIIKILPFLLNNTNKKTSTFSVYYLCLKKFLSSLFNLKAGNPLPLGGG